MRFSKFFVVFKVVYMSYKWASLVILFLFTNISMGGEVQQRIDSKELSPPIVTELKLTGNFSSMGVPGATAVATYKYYDADGDHEGSSKYDWFVVPSNIDEVYCLDNIKCIKIANSSYGTDDINPTLALSSESIGTAINLVDTPFGSIVELSGLDLVFCVTPAESFSFGSAMCVRADDSLAMGDIKPSAIDLSISPTEDLTQLKTVYGHYTYFIPGDYYPEGKSRAVWRNENGVILKSHIDINSASELTFMLATEGDSDQIYGHKIQLCVTPITDSNVEGEPSCSVLTDEVTRVPNFYAGCKDGLLYDEIQDKTFTCPLIPSEAESFNIEYQDSFTNINENFGPLNVTHILFDWDSADKYCKHIMLAGEPGRLPGVDELTSLWVNMDGDNAPNSSTMVTEHGWPTVMGYWSSWGGGKPNQHITVGLFMSDVESHSDSMPSYVSCVFTGNINTLS